MLTSTVRARTAVAGTATVVGLALLLPQGPAAGARPSRGAQFDCLRVDAE